LGSDRLPVWTEFIWRKLWLGVEPVKIHSPQPRDFKKMRFEEGFCSLHRVKKREWNVALWEGVL